MILNLKDFSQYRGEDQKQAILKHLGETVNSFALSGNRVWVATYIQPSITTGGIFLSEKTVDESKYQGKVGFVLKKGPMAFMDDPGEGGTKFHGFNPDIGDWVHYRPTSGREIGFCNVHIREFADFDISGTVFHPELIW